MKSVLLNLVERQVTEFRRKVGISDTEAVNLKSLLLKLNVLTVYRPLSETFSGMSLKKSRRKTGLCLLTAISPAVVSTSQ